MNPQRVRAACQEAVISATLIIRIHQPNPELDFAAFNRSLEICGVAGNKPMGKRVFETARPGDEPVAQRIAKQTGCAGDRTFRKCQLLNAERYLRRRDKCHAD